MADRSSVNIVNLVMERQTLRDWKSSSFLSYCEEVFVKKMVENEERNFEVKAWHTRTGAIQAIAFSRDGLYMASGHTSKHHEVYVHQLVPKARIFNKLVGHPRTPWCLTFDPSCTYILYSGCLEGVVKRWNIETGTLLGSFSSGTSTPVSSIVVLPHSPAHILVAMKNALYLISGEKEMQVVWKSDSLSGDLRVVKYWAGRNKLLTAIQVLSLQATYRLQVHDFNLKVPTDLIIGRGVRCRGSPRCLAATSNSVIFCDTNGSVVMCANHCSDDPAVWNRQCLYAVDVSSESYSYTRPRVSFMDLSPCEKYLLLCIKECKPGGRSVIIIVDLERKELVLKEHYIGINCGLWMPLSGAYGMGVCLGNNVGTVQMLTFYQDTGVV